MGRIQNVLVAILVSIATQLAHGIDLDLKVRHEDAPSDVQRAGVKQSTTTGTPGEALSSNVRPVSSQVPAASSQMNYRVRNAVKMEAAPRALDVFDATADFGHYDPERIVIRLQPATAAKLHVERIATKKLSPAEYALPATAVKSAMPSEILGLAPFVSGEERAHEFMKSAPGIVGQKMQKGEALTAGETAALAKAIEAQSKPYGPEGLFYAKVAPGTDIIGTCQRMYGAAEVIYAEPSPVSQPLSTPNDPYFSRMWHLDMTHVPAAWDYSSNTPGSIRVCVVDTGVRIDHTELAGRIADPVDVNLDNGDAYGNSNADDDDEQGHGTSCAGIIGSIRDNSSLVSGIAPVTIIPVSGGGYDPYGNYVIYNYADGVMAGVNRNADIVSLSLGGTRSSAYQAELDAAALAQANGVLVFAATGNENGDADRNYPSAIPYFVAVGAVDTSGARVQNPPWWWGSNYGNTVDICAPGQGNVGDFQDSILTINRNSNTDYRNNFNGTSAATPIAAGIAALVMHTNPALTAAQVRQILEDTAVDMVGSRSEDTAGWDPYHGRGLVDAEAAVQRAAPTAPVLHVSPGSLQVGAASSSQPITVTNTGSGTMTWAPAVTSGDTWISLSNISAAGVNPGSFTAHFGANDTGGARQGAITVTASGATGSPKTITITQDAEATPFAELQITRGQISERIDNDGDSYASEVTVTVEVQKSTLTGDAVEGFTRIYAQDPVSGEWIYGGESDSQAILNPETVSWRWPVFEGEPRGFWNFRIELYRAGQSTPDDTRSNSNEPNFSGVALESPSEDAVVNENSVQLSNQNNYDCIVLNVSPVTSPEWGENLLATDLAPGASRTIDGFDDDNYDLRVIFADGQAQVLWDQAIYGGGSFEWTVLPESGPNSVRVMNNSSLSCTGVYISSTSSPFWGLNRLSGAIAPGASYDFTELRNDAYDMRTVFANGDEEVQWSVLLEGGVRYDWTVGSGGGGDWESISSGRVVDYANCWERTGHVRVPGATEIRLVLDDISWDPYTGYDLLYIGRIDNWTEDGNGVVIGVDGDYQVYETPASGLVTYSVAGDTIDLLLDTDSVDTGSFTIKEIEYRGVATGTPSYTGTIFSGSFDDCRTECGSGGCGSTGTCFDVDDKITASFGKSVAPETVTVTAESENAGLPAILVPSGSKVWRINPSADFAEPATVQVPILGSAEVDRVQLWYYSETDSRWYLGENVRGWLVPESVTIVEQPGQWLVRFRANHGGVFQVGTAIEVDFAPAGVVRVHVFGPDARWMAAAASLCALALTLGCIVRYSRKSAD